MGAEHRTTVTAQINAAGAGPIERIKHGAVTWFTTFAAMAAIPVLLPDLSGDRHGHSRPV
jgi:hypothetical protein